MEIEINPAVASELVSLARQIAVQRGYPDLVNGLQPLERPGNEPGLNGKYEAELKEFRDSLLKGREWLLSEAADLLYYAACIDEQAKQEHYRYGMTLAHVHTFGISERQCEAAALAKYRLRAAGPKDFQAENAAIMEAIARL
jgi:hypothetical protein